MNTIHKNRKRGFTLLEIILVIAAIGILAAIVLVAINPNRQLAQARNAERRSEVNTIYKAIEQYLIDTGSYPAGITTSIQDICINGNTTNCVNLGVLVPDYIAAIPIDPGGAAYKVGINAGNNRVSVIAINAELGQGIGVNDRPWTPANINTALWLDAADASTVTTVSGAVSQWNDKSGNGRNATQGTSSSRPTYQTNSLNGKSGILFGVSNPTGLDLPSSLLNGVTSGSVLYVAKGTEPNSTVEQSGILNNWSTLSVNDHEPYSNSIYNGWLANTRYEGASVSYDLRNGYISRIASSSTAWNYFLNGSPYINKTTNTVSTSITPKIGLTTQSSPIRTRSVIYEIVFFSSVLSNSDFQKLEGYLAWKWGLTNNLPANHPYKWNGTEFGGVNITDTDAQTYIAAVETADGQSLENNTRLAIQNFIVGAKADGIWDAIKSSNILAGARTLNGALVPLKGTAPTNFNFVSGDYNRKTGLVGDGSTKYLNSNRNNNADERNSNHNAIYASTTANGRLIGADGNSTGGNALGGTSCWNRYDQVTFVSGLTAVTGFLGANRGSLTNFTHRRAGVTSTVSALSVTPSSGTVTIFQSGGSYSNSRLSFYSIGEAIDLALLDVRVTALMNELTAAIP